MLFPMENGFLQILTEPSKNPFVGLDIQFATPVHMQIDGGSDSQEIDILQMFIRENAVCNRLRNNCRHNEKNVSRQRQSSSH